MKTKEKEQLFFLSHQKKLNQFCLNTTFDLLKHISFAIFI